MINEALSAIGSIDPVRFLGAVALLLSALAYLPRADTHTKAIFALASFFWAGQCFAAGASTGGVMVMIAGLQQAMSIERSHYRGRGHRAASPPGLTPPTLMFGAAMGIGAVISWQGTWSMVPLLGSLMGLATFSLLSGPWLRYGMLMTTWAFVPYAMAFSLYEQVANAFFQTAALAMAWFAAQPRSHSSVLPGSAGNGS